jgi:hypothetical protein
MTTHTQTPTCPDSRACDSSAHLYRENADEILRTCPCRCHRIDGQRQNARHYIDEARERRRAAAVMPVTVISDTGIQQGTLHADDSITVDDGLNWICRKCHRPISDEHEEQHGNICVTTAEPSIEQLQDWSDNGGMEATDGCEGIEDDGTCEHGAPSWMLHLNLI